MATILLTKGYVAEVDDEDLHLVRDWLWRAHVMPGQVYAMRSRAWGIAMHRLLLGATQGQCVDHIDGNGLNNRRSNLRLASRSQNGANRGPTQNRPFKGVVKMRKRFQARITVDYTIHYLGTYDTEIEAAAAYDAAARQRFGEFAKTNFP